MVKAYVQNIFSLKINIAHIQWNLLTNVGGYKKVFSRSNSRIKVHLSFRDQSGSAGSGKSSDSFNALLYLFLELRVGVQLNLQWNMIAVLEPLLVTVAFKSV